MLEWVAQNADAIKAVIALIGSFMTLVVIPLLVYFKKADRETAQVIANGVEVAKGATIRTIQQMEKDFKDGKITIEELATAIDRGLKREIAEQALRSGFKSVAGKVAEVAANADPKKKPVIGFLGRLFKRKEQEQE